MKIIGAGMAGLIAGHMMRRHVPTILEASSALPENHSALLRFRSEAVANATSIPFEKVYVRKGVVSRNGDAVASHSTIPDMNAYAAKVTGSVMVRSIGQIEGANRWVAPPDFTSKLYASLPCGLLFDSRIDELQIGSKKQDEVWISTIPMPVMMNLVGWNKSSLFQSKEITTIVAEIQEPLTSVYQTVYLPYKDIWGDFYRASIHGSQLILEGVGSKSDIQFGDGYDVNNHDCQIARKALQDLFGMDRPIIKGVTRKCQKFGKILPIDNQEREAFILYLTEQHNIYSLGRFATWRSILLDDVVNDISVIDRLMSKSPYTRKKH